MQTNTQTGHVPSASAVSAQLSITQTNPGERRFCSMLHSTINNIVT